MKPCVIHPFRPEQAGAVSALIGRVLLEVNIKDYAEADLMEFAEYYSPQTVLELAEAGRTYVVTDGETVAGCGSIVPLETEGEREIRAVFVLPEYEGRGLGRALVETLEADPLFTGADRVLVSASITAHPFYAKLGYRYVGGVPVCEDNDHYWMEKFPKR